MKKFRFVWKDGTENIGEGIDYTEAFKKLGFGAGSVPALDYWEEVK